jgi:DNA-binding NarL/FixJ family response regulator
VVSIKSIRVAIADDNELLVNGLRMFLCAFKDFEYVGVARDCSDALSLCDKTHPDVMLMDLAMTGGNGLSTVKLIKQLHPLIRVIALISFEDQELKRKALESGAVDCMPRNVLIDEIADAIRKAMVISHKNTLQQDLLIADKSIE